MDINDIINSMDWQMARSAIRKRLATRIPQQDLDDAVQEALTMLAAIRSGDLPITEGTASATERYGAGLLIAHCSKRVLSGWTHANLDPSQRCERWEYADLREDGTVSPLSRSAHYAAKYGA